MDTTMSLTEILRDAQDLNGNIRYTAECNLSQLQHLDLPDFLLSLSAELCSNESPPECRRLAGIILKNSVDGRHSADGDLLINQWINLDQLNKSNIKESLLVTLGSSVPEAWQASSQVIAKVAYIEIPRREWRDLVGKLLANMAQQGASSPLKQATLEALGYVFEEIVQLGPDEVNAVLRAVIQAMNKAELSSQVRLAAAKALQNVLKHANFANDGCRNLIMSTILDTAESDEAEMIKQEAFGCLVVIASKYYAMLEPYMETILGLTTEALKGGVESGALQCIEFWITMCEKVIELQEQNKTFAHAISTADCHFIEKPLSSIVPVLLQTLLDQEGVDSAQSISMSGMTCRLGLIARTVGDAVVPLAMQFVEGNIKVSVRLEESQGSYICTRRVISRNLLPLSVCCLTGWRTQTCMVVRCTAVCSLRWVFELLIHSPACANRIFTDANLPRIVAVLAKRSKDVPEVSKEACGAIYIFSCQRIPTSASAYEALCEVVRVSNLQDYKASVAIGVLMPRVMRRLNTVLDAKASLSGDRMNKYDLLVLLCGVLHVIIKKLGNTFALWRTPFVLLLFCRVLTCDGCAARDKAALAIGALSRAIGPDFADHMPILLQYFKVKRLFPTYLRVIGNIFHVLGDRILPYCDDMMDVLYRGLSKPTLKPAILECFGEIALAIGKNFDKYLEAVMKKLKDAADPGYYDDVLEDDEVEYGNRLRQGIFKAYSGILYYGV